MQFNLSTFLAMMLFLLTGTSLADGCYKGGTTWADLGDDAAISDAFNRLCDRMAGEYKLHDNVGQARCDRVIRTLAPQTTLLMTKII